MVEEGLFVPNGCADILTAALDKRPNGSRVQGVGHFITTSTYFNKPMGKASEKQEAEKICDRRYAMMAQRFDELKAQISAFVASDIGSCSIATKSPTC
ncbi:unnamed protein product, partial [Cuscuta epithymum]